jgi:hypothetical protein
MKKIITILLLVSISLLGKSQENDTIPDLLPYEDAAAGLFISKVVEVKDKSQKDLITQFKNWASTRFVNLKEVIVSETDNQIVLNYITKTNSYMKTLGMKSPMNYSWYVRMVVQFKDGKTRAQFYDDGNSFIPGEYSKYGNVPAVTARTMYVHDYIKKPENIKDLHRNTISGGTSGILYDTHCEWQSNIMNMAISFEKGMLDATIVGKKDDF